MNKVKMLENKQIEVQMEAILDSKKGQRYFNFIQCFYCYHFHFYPHRTSFRTENSHFTIANFLAKIQTPEEVCRQLVGCE